MQYTLLYPAVELTVTNVTISFMGYGDNRRARCWTLTAKALAEGSTEHDEQLNVTLDLPLTEVPPAIGSQIELSLAAATGVNAAYVPALKATNSEVVEAF